MIKSSRSARRLAKVQEIQQMLNKFVEHRHRKNSKHLNTFRKPKTTNNLSTIFFDANDVPYSQNTNQGTKHVLEKLPDILDGIKMTTSTYDPSSGRKIDNIFYF